MYREEFASSEERIEEIHIASPFYFHYRPYRLLDYRKNSKIWDTSNNCHNCPKNRKVWRNIALMHPKDADGMANSVDPDQTASSGSSLILVCTV